MALVRLCSVHEMPAMGQMCEREAGGRTLCVANDGGAYAAVDNECPHSGGPLAEGSLENGKVLCPWHAWGFDLQTGRAEHDRSTGVRVYPLRVEGEDVLIEVQG